MKKPYNKYTSVFLHPAFYRRLLAGLLTACLFWSVILLPALSVSAAVLYTQDEANIRKEPKKDSEKVGALEPSTQVTLLSESGNWIKIRTEEGKEGYIYKDLLGNTPVETNEEGEKEEVEKDSGDTENLTDIREKAISYGQEHLGDTYSQKHRNESGYADCSSLVRDAYEEASGEYIGDDTRTQSDVMNSYFYEITSLRDVEEGDLVYHLSKDNHTGIYLGDGKVLHASKKAGKVVVTEFSLDSDYWEYGCNAASYCSNN